MTDVLKEEGKKTIVSFVVGLLIGGILVWAFTGGEETQKPADKDEADKEMTQTDKDKSEAKVEADIKNDKADTKPVTINQLSVGDGAVVVEDQLASSRIALKSATYPVADGWIGVRDYSNENLGGILGVVRFSESQGLVPKNIILQRPTKAGSNYAVVIFTENGDRVFNSATDVQLPTIFATFKAE